MENMEKEVLNKYKLWQEVFKKEDLNVKDSNENYIFCDYSSCKGCGCYADVRVD
jgi:hypothetical protein